MKKRIIFVFLPKKALTDSFFMSQKSNCVQKKLQFIIFIHSREIIQLQTVEVFIIEFVEAFHSFCNVFYSIINFIDHTP